MAVERPVLHLPSRSAVVLYDGVPAMAVDVTRRRVEGALSTGSECVSMVVEQLRQGDGIRTGSDIPRRGGGMIGVDGTFNLVRGPATAFLSGAEGYSTNHVYLHRPNAFGFWQTRLHLCYETLKRVSNFSELA